MTRDQYLLSIRPTLDLVAVHTAIESFQNATLRPILKFQNELFVVLFQEKIKHKKSDFEKLNLAEKRSFIEKIYQKDLVFKQQNMGIVVGMFTQTELDFFLNNKQESVKRIISMLIQRLSRQV